MKSFMWFFYTIFLVFIIAVTLSSCKNENKKSIENFATVNNLKQKDTRNYYLPSSTTNKIITHQFYSLSYSEAHEQAEWVAYELKKEQLSKTNFERPYFIDDPKVNSGSASYRNYKRSGYDKGHLCPAGDRKFSREAFNETFYTSNISPQLNDFNAGIWGRLEQKARYWASKYDGVFVVTGGVLRNNLKTIGSEKVSVPEYFYKILLDQNNGKYKTIAFLLPHKDSNKPLYEFVVPIDKIEQLTAIDFFPKLPDNVENEIEKSSDYKNWAF
jgi:endonuclease G, mitochondrial